MKNLGKYTVSQDVARKSDVDSKLTTPAGSNGQFMFRNASTWVAQGTMTAAQAEAGTETIGRTLSASVLKSGVQSHQIQPDWNASASKAQILNKPDLTQYALKSEVSTGGYNETYRENGFFIASSPQAMNENGLKVTTATSPEGTKFASVAMGDTMKKAWQNAIGVPYDLKPIFGFIRGRVQGNAQVVTAGTGGRDLQWDISRKIEQNITFSNDWNGWLIPEDGVYLISFSVETVDSPAPYGIDVQRWDKAQDTWYKISAIDYNSYNAVGRGKTHSVVHHFKAGDRVNTVIEAMDHNTRVGELSDNGITHSHFSITRIAPFENSLAPTQSAQPTGRLFKKVIARVAKTNGSRELKYSFDIPAEFRGRKFRTTAKLYSDWGAMNASKSLHTQFYEKRWTGSAYRTDQHIMTRTVCGYHDYFEYSSFHENTQNDLVLDYITVDRDNVNANSSLSGWGDLLLETID